jgi:uncharacterized protein with von Willebrand factor type A (vWA) domain
VLRDLLLFGRVLRTAGFDAGPGRIIDVAAALQRIDVRSADVVYHTCRTLLVSRADQIPIFDRAFQTFFSGTRVPGAADAPATHPSRDDRNDTALPSGEHLGSSEPSRTEPVSMSVGLWSDAGGLANKDFALFSAEEIAIGHAALERLVWQPGERRTRRWVAGHGPRVDLRRAISGSLRTGGDIVSLPRQRRRTQPRTLVLLCDVSGSMERYSRMLLHFAHSIAARRRHVEVFLFSTQLTRVTMEVRAKRLDAAFASLSRAVPDWSGGTRIGDALAQFHRRWARRVLHRGPVVLLISDGWDRGDPALLRDQIKRLRRSSSRLIWLNPLLGTTDYAPLTRGLQAALPYVDDFLPVRTLNDLGDLADHLNALPPRHGSRSRVPVAAGAWPD